MGLFLFLIAFVWSGLAMSQEDAVELLISALGRANQQSPLPSEQTEQHLVSAIELYQAIKRVGGWRVIPDGPVLQYGEMSGRTEMIRQRLITTGDLERPDRSPGNYFDSALAEGVRRFQVRHGLQADARVGPDTLAAMNVSVTSRLAQLQRNLSRLHNLRSMVIEAQYVLVNIPAFDLIAVEHDLVHLTSRVIVGRKDRPTPELSSRISSVDFRPTWNVPPGIARNDLVPKLRSDPGYFDRQRISVYSRKDGSRIDPAAINWDIISPLDVRFRQPAGPSNVLGRIRLNMPNDAFIYLHDTPDKLPFRSTSRAFSSGCIRVGQILPLTGWLLSREPGGLSATAESLIESDRPVTITLQRSIPIYLVYLTAWAQAGAIAHFRQDIYGLDLIGAATVHDDQLPNAVRVITP